MIETKNLCKVYKPKKGVPVTALNNISLTFPNTGMVFLLGKSGSGKSTLLNVLGGLDKYDDGEILIKGVSSKNFTQSHFDSYRNTYVGFIFQEYNVLEDFTVGANVALAIELQNRKATDDEINKILHEVDLDGYGARRPNELSGGQKQRVAIARALVKNPEIIMADEPTGALDSATGRQVLDTLKKLSSDHLVIIVSHDREFAEKYADRIIELADGSVINDVESLDAPCDIREEENDDVKLTFDGGKITVAGGYHLTEEDRIKINEYLDSQSGGAVIEHKFQNDGVCKRNFAPTQPIKSDDKGSDFKLIKSRLPMHNAFRIGGSGLKHKKVRLVFTILLSCIAFGLFALADTFGAYDNIKACTNSLVDTGIKYASFQKEKVITNGASSYNSSGYYMSDGDVKALSDKTGIVLRGVYDTMSRGSLDFLSNVTIPETENPDEDAINPIYPSSFNGFVEIDESYLKSTGSKLVAGKLPDGSKDEIAISSIVAGTFKKYNYTTPENSNPKGMEIKDAAELVGKTITLDNRPYTISGIIDTGLDFSRYEPLANEAEHPSASERLISYALQNELMYATCYSLTGAAMIGSGGMQHIYNEYPAVYPVINNYCSFTNEKSQLYVSVQYVTTLDKSKEKITWFDGKKKVLADNEIVVPYGTIAETEESKNQDGTDNPSAIGKIDLRFISCSDNGDEVKGDNGYKIVGYYGGTDDYSTVICSENLAKKISTDGKFTYALGAMPDSKADIKSMLIKSDTKDSQNFRYSLANQVTFELDTVNDVLKTLANVFLYIGLGFALFAALMLANFIGTSIAYKKQEIGILRAIGSRSADVFRIFFSESFIIAMINFVLSTIGTFVVTAIINSAIRREAGVFITVLNFGLRQVGLLLLVSIVVAAIASFIPVWRIARKRPIDAIRNR